jgi:hypothetical protein
MKRNVLTFGIISGIICATWMAVSMAIYRASGHASFENGMLYGYAGMLIAFSMIFVGIKNYRDKYNDGIISFGKAFKVGLYIALIGSTFYVATWLVEYYFFMPDFMDKYAEQMLESAKKAGASADELMKTQTEMQGYKDMYKNPLFVILFTYLEILPIGLLISLIAAAILKKKSGSSAQTQTMGG